MISRENDIRITWFLWIIILLFDQITKYLIRKNLLLGDSIPVIPDIFHITHVSNTGAAFGIFPNAKYFFIIAHVIAIAFFIYFLYIYKQKNPAFYISIGLILGGATGNLLDRIIFGKVTDFLDFGINSKLRWPAFNIADSCVVIGFFILALLVVKGDLFFLKKKNPDKKSK